MSADVLLNSSEKQLADMLITKQKGAQAVSESMANTPRKDTVTARKPENPHITASRIESSSYTPESLKPYHFT